MPEGRFLGVWTTIGRRPRLRGALLCTGLLGLLWIVYAPALNGAWLLDDRLHVTAPELRSWQGLWRIWTEPGLTQQYYPLLHTAFWIQHAFWGDVLWPYHAVSVLEHAAVSLLLVRLLQRLALPGAWLAGFLFAMHPMQVESVAWIAEQKNTQSALFSLLAGLAWIRYRESHRRWHYLAASLAFLAALLSKTAAVTVPPALLLLAWWQHGRIDLRRDLTPLLPWFAAACLAGLITLRVEQALIDGVQAVLPMTVVERLLLAARALVFYATKLLWPAELSFLYERWTLTVADPAAWLYPAWVLAAMGVCGWWAKHQRRGPLASLLFFAGTLAPVLGFVNVEWFVFSFVADHFVYLASLGLLVPAAALLQRHAPAPLGVAWVLALAVLSTRHSHHFAGPVELYSHAAAQSPGSAVAQYHLALALLSEEPRREEAISAFRATLALNPAVADAHARLGLLLTDHPSQRAEAVAHLETALRLDPRRADLYLPLADALAEDPQKLEAALKAYDAAIAHDARSFAAHFNSGNALLRLGRPTEAVSRFETSIRLRPDDARAHSNLGMALATTPGRLRESVQHFVIALRLDPGLEVAARNLEQVRAALEAGNGRE